MDTTEVHYQVQLTEKYWKEGDLTIPLSVIVKSAITFQNIEVQYLPPCVVMYTVCFCACYFFMSVFVCIYLSKCTELDARLLKV